MSFTGVLVYILLHLLCCAVGWHMNDVLSWQAFHGGLFNLQETYSVEMLLARDLFGFVFWNMIKGTFEMSLCCIKEYVISLLVKLSTIEYGMKWYLVINLNMKFNVVCENLFRYYLQFWIAFSAGVKVGVITKFERQSKNKILNGVLNELYCLLKCMNVAWLITEL
jgi:hypothetical protein